MSRKIPDDLRKAVAQRAGYRCEYCLVSETDSVTAFEVDHIFPIKHGGPTIFENLAYTCIICNRHKGCNIATSEYASWILIPLFNPRKDVWGEHFEIEGETILGITEVGRATIKVLELNHIHRLLERRLLMQTGSYPG